MWILPPLVGQKVVLDPSGSSYNHYSARQARGDAGYINKINDDITYWYRLNERQARGISVIVTWDNGHSNGYRLHDLLPVDSYRKSYFVRTSDGDELRTEDTERLDAWLDHKIINKGYKIHLKKDFDEEYRKETFRSLAGDLDIILSSGAITERQLKMIDELVTAGYKIEPYRDNPIPERPDTAITIGDIEGMRRVLDRNRTAPIELTNEFGEAMERLTERHGVVEYRTDGRYHVANDDEEPLF